jgi:hypothetical protein
VAALGGVFYWSERGALGISPIALDSAATKAAAPIAVDSTPVVTKPLPRLDSISAARAQKAADSAAAETALHAPLVRYAKAFETSNLEMVIQAFPNMPDGIRSSLRRFLEGTNHIRATPVFGTPTVNGDRAELLFTVRMRYSHGSQPLSSDLKYQAVLTKKPDGKWEIAELRPE